MTKTFKIVDGDVSFSSATGRPFSVQDSAKLSQDLNENFLIEQQPTGVGADLDGMIALIGDSFSLRAELAKRVNGSIEALQELQDIIQRSSRSKAEKASRVVAINVMPVANPATGQVDATRYAFRVDIISESGERETITGTLGGVG